MIASNGLLVLLAWLAEQLGLTLELPEPLFAGLLDGREIAEQLRYGRD